MGGERNERKAYVNPIRGNVLNLVIVVSDQRHDQDVGEGDTETVMSAVRPPTCEIWMPIGHRRTIHQLLLAEVHEGTTGAILKPKGEK